MKLFAPIDPNRTVIGAVADEAGCLVSLFCTVTVDCTSEPQPLTDHRAAFVTTPTFIDMTIEHTASPYEWQPEPVPHSVALWPPGFAQHYEFAGMNWTSQDHLRGQSVAIWTVNRASGGER